MSRIPGSRRFEDWPARLAAFFDKHRTQPFRWGERDCCLFSCNGVRAITGIDPAAKVFRGKYRGAAGAMRLVRKHGGVEAIAEAQCARYGFAEWSLVAQARRGDLLLMDTAQGAGPALGICDGATAVFVGFDSASIVSLSACRRAWRID